jgi:hypothetical protein
MSRVTADGRPLFERIRALARRYDAIAAGAGKRPGASLQDVGNAQRDAATLHDAADELERRAR